MTSPVPVIWFETKESWQNAKQIAVDPTVFGDTFDQWRLAVQEERNRVRAAG